MIPELFIYNFIYHAELTPAPSSTGRAPAARRPGHRPRGRRRPQNQIKLRRQASNGQYSLTLPAGVAKALRCQGGEVFEVFIEQGAIVLRWRSR